MSTGTVTLLRQHLSGGKEGKEDKIGERVSILTEPVRRAKNNKGEPWEAAEA
jgi:hypothetical protein